MPPMTSPADGLGPGRPSRTSIMVAAARAFGAREPDPSVRNPDWLAGVKVFEVDRHATQDLKKRRVIEVLGRLPANVTFVEIDFARETIGEVLRGAGYSPAEKTLFVWEGVCMYLAEEDVRATLRFISANAAPGSSLVMDYACRAVIDALKKYPNHPQHRFTTDWGEPWIFGVPDSKQREFFRECGL